jgi:hypothetical protein
MWPMGSFCDYLPFNENLVLYLNKLEFRSLHARTPVRIWVRIGTVHPHACRKRQLNGVVFRIRLEKPRSRVTVGVAQ